MKLRCEELERRECPAPLDPFPEDPLATPPAPVVPVQVPVLPAGEAIPQTPVRP
jgi:hypothetical protein